jgi:DNA polymerase-3 subunit gamma/tau
MIGQEVLVRTLTNAIEGGRLAHAYLFTGVRGVGKTTTARILARSINCVGPDGRGGPTIEPCGECEPCRAIAEDRHVDVLEMDAASHSGVAEIRDLIDGVRYRPVSARYKVYIIDEVHMLSKEAFNALLKTLEEPPPDVVFIFATTEIRKIPMTVLSRCQRFDLRRIEAEELAAYLTVITGREGVTASPAALALIARAADGSARDGLSILDQAIAHCGGAIEEDALGAMLGLADRVKLFDLFEALMRGEIGDALAELARQYAAGVDPIVVLQDLLDLTHWLTRLKVTPEAGAAVMVAEAERRRGGDLASRLSMPVLSRCWQMLLKALGEARAAPNSLAAVEMALVRIAYVADLPTPADLVKSLGDGGEKPAAAAAPPAASPPPPNTTPPPAAPPPPAATASQTALATAVEPDSVEPQASQPAPADPVARLSGPASFGDVVALVEKNREMVLLSDLRGYVRLVGFAPGRIEIHPLDGASKTLANDLGEKLSGWTGERWIVTVSRADGAPTLDEQAATVRAKRIAEAASHPLVAAVLETFSGAEITDVWDRAGPAKHDHGDDKV